MIRITRPVTTFLYPLAISATRLPQVASEGEGREGGGGGCVRERENKRKPTYFYILCSGRAFLKLFAANSATRRFCHRHAGEVGGGREEEKESYTQEMT